MSDKKTKKQSKTNLIAFVALVSLAVIAVGVIIGVSLSERNKVPDEIIVNEGAGIYAEIKIKDYGTIVLKLDPEAAPKTVENFVNLAKSGFYDGLTFHRIMKGFMMQGGDPRGNSSGSSGTQIFGEFAANGWTQNTLQHVRGTISMARSQRYDSASSQFFIMQQAAPHLDGNYAAFGHVVSGIEVVDAVCNDAKPTDSNGTIPSNKQPVMEYVRIYEVTDSETSEEQSK